MARIQRKAHDSSVVLYNHQKEAMCALNKADIGGEFSGIIVLPTGGGKTITASYWLTKNAINAHAKIIWVAHRKQLLEQAYSAFEKCATQDLLTDVAEYSMRIVSGEHDEPSQVSPKDDMRAGRIVDDLERLGIVEEFAGSKPRKINHTEFEKVIPK